MKIFSNFVGMLEPKRLFLIINPVSGTHSKDGLADRLIEGLSERGFDVTAEFTQCADDATRLAKLAVEQGFDGVLACGGDGTVNETARAMTGTGVAMGIIPAGSGNGLARHINIPIDPMMALDVIAERCVRDCDYGDVNGHPFFCTFGMGFDAAVSDRFAAAPSRGKMTYVKSALQEFVNYRAHPYRIVADGEEIADEAYVVAVCNASQYGNNAYIAPDASITDGLLDLVVIRNVPKASTVVLGVEMMAGTLTDNRALIKRKARNIEIYRDEAGPAHLDGEPFHDAGTDIKVTCHAGGLRLFTTESKTPFRPILTPIQSMVNDLGISLKNLVSRD